MGPKNALTKNLLFSARNVLIKKKLVGRQNSLVSVATTPPVLKICTAPGESAKK